jgi:hypothetical protein
MFIFCTSTCFAQETDIQPPSANASNIFIELGANGAFLSLNYDTRFTKTGKGLGIRAGIGFIPGFDIIFLKIPTILIIPVALNYLAGRGPHYFEGGVGLTYATAKSYLFGEEENVSAFAFIPSAGYRYQPLKKGFTGRAVISPYINSGGFQFFGGVSGGYRF